MDVITINPTGLVLGFSLLIIPLTIDRWLKLGLVKTTLWAVTRMSLQLFAVGLILKYLFQINNAWINLAWLVLMIVTAVFSTAGKLKLKLQVIFWPIMASFLLTTLPILLYFQKLILKLENPFDARYLIALGGMILGTVLTTNIVALNSFYQKLLTRQKNYLYRLTLSADQKEALGPFLREGLKLALLPTLAKTATMGIVSIPGMMTGQILAGASPLTAISYQIMIMVAIYTSDVISILLTVIFSTKSCFDDYGILKQSILKKR